MLKIEDNDTRKKIRNTVKHFYFILLNHMLKIINNISEQIKGDNSKKELKEKLLRYSSGINYKIANYVKNQLEIQIDQNKNLGDNMIKILDIKKKNLNKIDNLETIIGKQNSKLDLIISKLEKKDKKSISVSEDLENNKSVNSISNKSASSGDSTKSITLSLEEKLKEKFGCDNLESLFDDDDNNFEDIEENKTENGESIESLESTKNRSDTYSHASGIYKI